MHKIMKLSKEFEAMLAKGMQNIIFIVCTVQWSATKYYACQQ